ncbi:LysM peptidoglycan-binding domain-containing M23 family metallopeptidase [uncultured Litoreibacter sp.]|uniref:LysM peptidoglycan-binding domain-containing M23 family metallopeptidase n=1 Tax=uncultured Litoreibacter sp. TaxID=1392394 RepID=UPI0026108867|nr:LysM peptidoglycan-binding domain-containing M23 family metallopeptidase [uncultured Litoreibacter sp.]
MRNRRFSKILPIVALGFGLSACDQVGDTFANLDLDLRNTVGGLDTSNAARQATLDRPRPDDRGVISYPNYQVAVARRGDTVSTIAARVGGNPGEIAKFNGLNANDTLNRGEIVALPRSVPAPTTVSQPAPLDIADIATSAIDNAPSGGGIAQAQPSKRIDGPEPIRHRVERGETAYSIARLYNVSVRSLADWNGLGADLEVREDQYLLVPVVDQSVTPAKTEAAPGQGTVTPTPPSASKPLPEPVKAVEKPATPDTGGAPATATPVVATKSPAFQQPVAGKILRPYKKRKNEGIDIEAAAGAPVKAAADGSVAAITRDTDQVPILVVRHTGNVLTVYANITGITVKKGDKVSRGQTIAKVGPGSPPFLHFEVREGFESVNPAKYLN